MSEKKTHRIASLVLAAMLLTVPQGVLAQQGSRGICYRVTGGQNELFLLGSIHVGNQSMYPMAQPILDALSAANVLIYECDTQSADVLHELQALMYLPAGETLAQQVSAECYALVAQVAEKLGYPMGALDMLRPWAVVSMLTLHSTAAQLGVDDATDAVSLGVEQQVRELGAGKQTAYLETAQSQLLTMDGFSAQLQQYLLESVCQQILEPGTARGTDADIALWPTWWATGDGDAYAKSYLDGMASDPYPDLVNEYHQALVTKRNKQMATALQALMEQDGTGNCFATIGLLHLVLPDDSVVSELEKLGYTVERVE